MLPHVPLQEFGSPDVVGFGVAVAVAVAVAVEVAVGVADAVDKVKVREQLLVGEAVIVSALGLLLGTFGATEVCLN